MKTVLVDANVVLRFLRDDDAVQSAQARELIAGRHVRLVLTTVTLAEIFYALRTSYGMSRPATAELLRRLLGAGVFQVDEPAVLLDALERVKAANVDFGDAALAAKAAADDVAVATFDLDFKKFGDVRRHEW